MTAYKNRKLSGNFAIADLEDSPILRKTSKKKMTPVIYYSDNRLKTDAIVRIVNIHLDDYVYGHALHRSEVINHCGWRV